MNNLFKDLIVFEMANNHQGNLNNGIEIIREMGKIAKKHNIKAAVKLQYRNLDTFIHPEYKGRTDVAHIPRFESTKLIYEDFYKLVTEIRSQGMLAMSTPFDEEGVKWCADQDLDIIKVASCSALDWPLLEKIASTEKPVIISVGGKNLPEIDNIYNFFLHRNIDFALMHCVSEYPVPEDHIQLDFINKLMSRYPGVPIGYSGHEDPNDNIVQMMAVAKGAQILERHVGIETDGVKLNAYSLNPSQADEWIKSVKKARTICRLKKDNDIWHSPEEIASLRSLQRGVYAKKDMIEGDTITDEDIYFAMPLTENQMTSGEFKAGIIASRSYKKNEAVKEKVKSTELKKFRESIHDVKGLLNESGIAVGEIADIEFSHHYGIENFRKTGCSLINVINREYCKKIIIMLPGQENPLHYHKIKEETFQVLYGDLECVVNDKKYFLKPGDILTVKRMDVHSFSSINGAVFEEISTTHIKGDSFYSDQNISKQDYMQRKTIVKDW